MQPVAAQLSGYAGKLPPQVISNRMVKKQQMLGGLHDDPKFFALFCGSIGVNGEQSFQGGSTCINIRQGF